MKTLKKSVGKFAFSAFYFVTGLIMLIILILSRGTLVHIGLLGFLSLVISYGLIKMKKWVLYLVTINFFLGITLGATTIYSSTKLFDLNIITLSFQVIMVIYMVLLLISFLDSLINREKFV